MKYYIILHIHIEGISTYLIKSSTILIRDELTKEQIDRIIEKLEIDYDPEEGEFIMIRETVDYREIPNIKL